MVQGEEITFSVDVGMRSTTNNKKQKMDTVRLNVEISNEIHQWLKMKAVLERTTIRELVENAVVEMLKSNR